MDQNVLCSFCGMPRSANRPLIAGMEGHICEACVQLAHQVVVSWGRKRSLSGMETSVLVPAEIKKRLDQYVIGQTQAKETLAVAAYHHYTRLKHESSGTGIACSQDNVELGKSNILLLGPSGCGKTLLASKLAENVGVPFTIADATTLTQAGYVGEDVESILVRLLDAADGNVGLAEWGIVYIDEIDKLARNQDASVAVRDVSGEGVQQALLKLIEGSRVKLPAKARRQNGGEDIMIDTHNILFIAGGAFTGLDKVVEKRLLPERNGIGFSADLTAQPDSVDKDNLLLHVHPDDLRHYGLIPEFIGRFPVIAALDQLDEEALITILTEPKNALVRQYKKIFSYEGVELEFMPAALRNIAAEALGRGTGARGLRAVMEELLRPHMYEIPSKKEITRCIVRAEPSQGCWVEAVVDASRTDDVEYEEAAI